MPRTHPARRTPEEAREELLQVWELRGRCIRWIWCVFPLLAVGVTFPTLIILARLRAPDYVITAACIVALLLVAASGARLQARLLFTHCPCCHERFFNPWNSASIYSKKCRNCGVSWPRLDEPP